MTAHKDKVDAAIEKITEVHSDTSVSLQQTYDSLTNIRDRLNEFISAVEQDLENQENP